MTSSTPVPFDGLMNLVAHPVLAVDQEGNLLHFNQSFCDTFQLEPNMLEHARVEGIEELYNKQQEIPEKQILFGLLGLKSNDGLLRRMMCQVQKTAPSQYKCHYIVTAQPYNRQGAEPEAKFDDYVTLFNSIPFGMVLVDSENQVLDVNQHFVSMFGYSRDVIVGRRLRDMIMPGDRAHESGVLMSSVLSGQKVTVETVRMTADNTLLDVSITAVPVLTSDGKTRVFGIYQDISERRQMQRSLAEQERELAHIVACLPGMVYRSDFTKDYRLSLASQGSVRVTGYEPEVFTHDGMPFDAIIQPAFKEQIWKQWDRCVAEKTDFEAEYKITAADGSERWLWERGRPIFSEDGQIRFLEGYLEDITAQKRTQDELRRERDLLQALMDNIPDTIYFKDLESRFIRVNKAQARTLGLSDPAEAIGGTDADFFDAAHAASAFADEQRLMQTGIPVINKQEHLRAATGWKWFTSSKVPLRNAKGKIVGLVGISRDITEIKRLENTLLEKEANLRRLNSEKDKLFSVIAHDLRSPFNSFLLLTEILAEEAYDFEPIELKNLSTSMHRAAKSVAELLENLLSWSRIQREMIEPNPEFVELETLIDKNVAYFQAQTQSKSLEVQVRIEPNLALYTDPGMLSVILRNLYSNALKFTPQGGSIQLEALLENQQVLLKVQDSGIGIPAPMLETIFELENKGRKGTDGEPSSGLGLILVSEFVHRLGGELHIESFENKGTTFTVRLPVHFRTED